MTPTQETDRSRAPAGSHQQGERARFSQQLPYQNSDREETISPTVNDAFKRWEEYREFVKDAIWIAIQFAQSSAHLTRGMLTLSTSPSAARHTFTREAACSACLS